MNTLNQSIAETNNYPVKVIQFGEGNFLRGFVDWMIDRANRKNLFQGRVRVIQPIEQGRIEKLNNQDGLYTLISRGINQGETVREVEVISSIEKGINPYSDYEAFLQSADLPELRFIISNTTEAGITYNEGEALSDEPPISYPAKLTALLYRRFKSFKGDPQKGLVIIPCELIDRNGDKLKEIVFRLTDEWQLGEAFTRWLEESNGFLNSLVDRIVTGYPRDEIEELENELGYRDENINTAEVFNLWVIEGDAKYADEFPLKQAGCNVVWTDDMTPYRTRKVRILNGVHTMTCIAAHLYGLETVRDCLTNEKMNRYITKGLFEEIIPAVDFDKKELTSFARAVLERFANPFIHHALLSITLNSVSKFKARVLPTILEYMALKKKAPEILTFSLAALIHFYKEENPVSDNNEVKDIFFSLWKNYENRVIDADRFIEELLSQEAFWGQNLSENTLLKNKILQHFLAIENEGIGNSLEALL